jgi:hypothetical protein
MVSMDSSAAFDIVEVKLLLKCLAIVGIATDVVELIEQWQSMN